MFTSVAMVMVRVTVRRRWHCPHLFSLDLAAALAASVVPEMLKDGNHCGQSLIEHYFCEVPSILAQFVLVTVCQLFASTSRRVHEPLHPAFIGSRSAILIQVNSVNRNTFDLRI